MADGVAITAGSGTTILTDDTGATGHAQVVKLAVSANGDATLVPVDATRGLTVDTAAPRRVLSSATPTLSTTPAYTSGDQFGTVMTFTSAALANGGVGSVVNAVMSNRDTEFPPIELWLFQNSPTMVSTDNAAFDITDANLEAAVLLGVIELSAFYAGTNNNVATGAQRGIPLSQAPIPYVCGGSSTSLFGVMCVRGTPTQASTTDVVVTLTFDRER